MILAFTLKIAVVVLSAISLKAVTFALTTLVTSCNTCVLIKFKSALFARSIVVFAAAFTFITSTTEPKAVLKESDWLAPEPSTAAANAFITLII